ncbi:MAG: GNAT family N-acetyltransferase [Oscillospiraceae bacterium]|jgi:GNAT superfamily N-acetyltransferase|nr:GNAT family N-acetyltransferase [Oscillospiraceae bacterium]
MISFLEETDAPQILSLWQTCFGDDEAYIQFFLAHAFPLCRGIAAREEGRVVSMLFLLPGSLTQGETNLPAAYVYAVCTDPLFRSRGLAAGLIRFARDHAKDLGNVEALCLLPAEEGLYDYYARLGFRTAFARVRRIWAVSAADAVPLPLAPCVPAAARNRRWARLGYFAWEAPMLRYMDREHRFTGGQVVQWEGGTAYVCLEDGTLSCQELCAPAAETGAALERLAATCGVREGTALLSADCAADGGELEPGGMLLPLTAEAEAWLHRTKGRAYLGFPLE